MISIIYINLNYHILLSSYYFLKVKINNEEQIDLNTKQTKISPIQTDANIIKVQNNSRRWESQINIEKRITLHPAIINPCNITQSSHFNKMPAR